MWHHVGKNFWARGRGSTVLHRYSSPTASAQEPCPLWEATTSSTTTATSKYSWTNPLRRLLLTRFHVCSLRLILEGRHHHVHRQYSDLSPRRMCHFCHSRSHRHGTRDRSVGGGEKRSGVGVPNVSGGCSETTRSTRMGSNFLLNASGERFFFQN